MKNYSFKRRTDHPPISPLFLNWGSYQRRASSSRRFAFRKEVIRRQGMHPSKAGKGVLAKEINRP